MRRWLLPALALVVAGVAGSPAHAKGRRPERPAELAAVHANASQTVRFRTPAGWTVASRPGSPELTEARGDQLLVRILRRDGEWGIDGLHVDCMLERLAAPMETQPDVSYEYDFVGGSIGERRVLDSAFLVAYDGPVLGARLWRQRNLTVVGGGESICVIGYAPAQVWKKSKDARRLLDGVLGSVEMRPWR